MGITRFLMVLAVCCILTGCTARQIARADKGLADANIVGTAVTDLVSGPVGALLPPALRMVLELGAALAAAAVLAWQQIRGKLLRQTAAAVVQAIEGLDPGEKMLVKDAVRAEMRDREIYSRANAVIDSLKVT
jgi:hypothetical protein